MTLVLAYLLILQCTSQHLVVSRTEFKSGEGSYNYSRLHIVFITSVNKQYCFLLLEESSIWLGIYVCPVPIWTRHISAPWRQTAGLQRCLGSCQPVFWYSSTFLLPWSKRLQRSCVKETVKQRNTFISKFKESFWEYYCKSRECSGYYPHFLRKKIGGDAWWCSGGEIAETCRNSALLEKFGLWYYCSLLQSRPSDVCQMVTRNHGTCQAFHWLM